MKVRVLKDGRYSFTVLPRDDGGRKQAADDVNHHPAARRAADVGVEALGLSPWGERLFIWLRNNIPSAKEVAETQAEAVELGRRVARRVGSNDGRKAAWIDFITPNGVGVNLKFSSSDQHDEVLAGTPRSSNADQQVREASQAPLWALQVRAEKGEGDDEYIVDLQRLEWALIPTAALMRAAGGDLPSLAACKRTRVGAPLKGETLPFCWATQAKGTTCQGGSWKVKVRGLKPGKPGWSKGTVADLHAALAALV
jgi:hypothetical protein